MSPEVSESPTPADRPLPSPDTNHLEDARRTARNASALLAASVLSKGSLFIWQLILAFLIGAFQYGVYGTISSLMALGALVASFGMGLILIRDGAREPEKIGRYWTAMLYIQTLLAIVSYIGVLIAASGYNEIILGFSVLAGISLFVDLYGNLGFDLLITQERMVITSVVDVGVILSRIALAALLIASGWGLVGVYLATIATGVFRSVVLTWVNLKAGIRPVFPLDREIARHIFVASAPLAISGFITLIYQHVDKLMTTGILGARQTGYLMVAFVIHFGIVEVLSTTIHTATYPMLSRYYGRGDSPVFGFLIEKITLFMLIIGLPISLTLSLYSETFAHLLSEEFLPTAGILRVLVWYTFIALATNMISRGFLIKNQQRMELMIRVSGLVVNICLNLFLLMSWQDARGAAIASIFAESLILILLLITFKVLGWQLKRFLYSLTKLLLIGVVTGVVMVLLAQIHVIIGLIGGMLIYAGAVLGFLLSGDDKDLIYQLGMALPIGKYVERYWKHQVSNQWQK